MTDRRRAVITTPDLSHKAPTLDVPSPFVPDKVATAQFSLPGGADDNQKFMSFAFGLCETEGSIRYAAQYGNYLWIVRALCLGEREATIYGGEQAGECDALVGIYTDSGPFLNANFSYTWVSGSLSQTVHTTLAGVIAALGGTWAETLVITDKTGKRRAISHSIECWSNVAAVWSNGIPKIRYRFRGSRVLNTTTGLVQYTVSPVWQGRFWALDPSGGRMRPSRINEPSFQAAAAVTPSNQYESHLLLSASARECRKMFSLLWDGWMVFAGGNQLTAIADRNTAPVATYDDTHFAADQEIEAGPVADPDQMINSVSIEYTDTTDPSGVWKTKTLTLRTAGLNAGTETEVPVTFKFPQIQDPVIVNLKLGYLLYSYQAYRIKGKWLANAGGPRLMGDVVTQSVPARGISDNFRVMVRDKQPNGTYATELELIDARKWVGASATAPAKVGSTLQDPYSPPDITLASITWAEELYYQSGQMLPRVRLGWANPSYAFIDGVELYLSVNGGESRCLPGDATPPALVNEMMEIGVPYTITLVVRSTAGYRSAGTSITRTIAGKTAPPSDVVGLVGGASGSMAYLSWQPSSDLDVSEYEWRKGSTTDIWSTAVFGNKTRALHVQDEPTPGRTVRYFLKAIDGAGHYSANAVICDIRIDAVGGQVSEQKLGIIWDATAFTRIINGSTPSIPGFGGLWHGTGNLYVSETVLGPGSYSIQIMLDRAISPVAIDAEAAAAGLTLAQWETQIDAPRRGGAGLWAPLPANAQGEIYGAGAGFTTRLAEHRARLVKVSHLGVDTPSNVAVAQPFFAAVPTLNSTTNPPVVKSYGSAYLKTPDDYPDWIGIRLSTNSPLYQQIVTDDGSSASSGFAPWIAIATDKRTYIIFAGSVRTDASGIASVHWPPYTPLAAAVNTDCLSLEAVVGSNGSGNVIVSDVTSFSGRTVTFRSYKATDGTAAPNIAFSYKIIDNGGPTTGSGLMP